MSPRPPVASPRNGGGTRSLLGLLFGVSLHQQAVLFRQLATMIDSGLTSGRAMESLSLHVRGHFGGALRDIAAWLDEGTPLHQCLAKFPEYFSELVVSLVQAGETGGQLDLRLKEIADMLEQSYELRQKLISQSVYPLVILHAGIFIPPLYKLITGGPVAYGVAVLWPLVALWGGLLTLLAGNRLVSTVGPLRVTVDAFVLALPLVGRVVRDGSLVQALRALGDLLEAGVPTAQALQIAARAAGNAAVGHRLVRIEDLLDDGESLSSAMAQTGVMPPTVMQMVVAGEASGTLGASLKKAANLLQIDFDNAVRRMAAVVPALLLLFVAGLIGWQYISFFREYVGLMNSLFP